ncbi:hydroxymethylpyrimidine/phosphomethylpyrimidine kinase [Prevotella sp. kh1p2]|uniref:hydroxymethylpyrimidine/phosphomethylpyrimidine kinase n=1 Tax=Prevotella sp. kh1p2 TaxID=1761883 RepID=UPI0008C1009E|nr:hydroxymethylpyrimidine/phosphomethylpyrimidine kinase [Prevotella sp. kh1p2]SES71926.1 hydroxymethylpyrimidine/phosphomethylpyrimidine kinase [Prevotella sp. kh1p2]SNU10444.1 hydroxymethylpyrimidine/phosphomethylpyrimidine kinase [Prevotellaceae bacterium KH2P17]
MSEQRSNTVLSVTGSDSIGESGAQADIRIIASIGGQPLSAITSVTMQNTVGIQQFYDLPATIVSGQMEAVLNDVQPDVVKIGMVRRIDVVEAICRSLERYRPRWVVFHPVIFSSRGEQLMDEQVAQTVRRQLLPLCTLIVLKRTDAHYLLGCQPDNDPHLLFLDNAYPAHHGLGNGFSSAIAAYLSLGYTMSQAVSEARTYVAQHLRPARRLKGRSHELYGEFMEQMEAHFRSRSDVQFYADSLNVSSRYLGQVTRRVSGRSPKSIIDSRLTEEIKNRLLTTPHTVQETAFALGFSSQAQLSRFFRKMTGLSPSQFKKAGEGTGGSVQQQIRIRK